MKTTEFIISELQQSLSFKRLKINKLDSPVTSGYSEEWDPSRARGGTMQVLESKMGGMNTLLHPTNLYLLKLNQQSIGCKVRLSEFTN